MIYRTSGANGPTGPKVLARPVALKFLSGGLTRTAQALERMKIVNTAGQILKMFADLDSDLTGAAELERALDKVSFDALHGGGEFVLPDELRHVDLLQFRLRIESCAPTLGMCPGLKTTSARTPKYPAPKPSAPPAIDSKTLSVSSCNMIRLLAAPSAARVAISRLVTWRPRR